MNSKVKNYDEINILKNRMIICDRVEKQSLVQKSIIESHLFLFEWIIMTLIYRSEWLYQMYTLEVKLRWPHWNKLISLVLVLKVY